MIRIKRSTLLDPANAGIHFLLFLVVCCVLFWSFAIDRHMATDGVYYFWDILENGRFVNHDWARKFALYLTQWPLVLAVKMGVQDIGLLKWVFASGIFSIFLLSFFLCLYALRGKDKSLMIWPLLSMVGLNLSCSALLSGEFPVLMLISWPILFLILRENPRPADRFLLILLLFISTRLYQSAMAIAPVFLILIVYQQYRTAMKRGPLHFILLVVLCIAVFVVAFYTSLKPFSTDNRSSFLQGLLLMRYHLPALTSIAFISVFAAAKFAGWKKAELMAAIPVILFLITLFFTGNVTKVFVSFAARSLSATFLPLMIAAAAVFHYRKMRIPGSNVVLVTLFTLVIAAGEIKTSYCWIRYKDEFRSTLRRTNGFVPIEQTKLADDRCYWNWTNPYMSLVWSDGCVRSIILNDSLHRRFPYDPDKELLLTGYLRYDAIFQPVDRRAKPCRESSGTP